MTVSPTSASALSAAAGAAQKTLGKDDFLTLLTTQLRNQDPLSPMTDRDFIAQMAQLSSLDATQGMGTQIGDLVAAQQRTQALQLVGRDVDYAADDAGTVATGKVTAVLLHDAQPMLMIGSAQVPLESVQSVH